jgi:hypothetical protein
MDIHAESTIDVVISDKAKALLDSLIPEYSENVQEKISQETDVIVNAALEAYVRVLFNEIDHMDTLPPIIARATSKIKSEPPLMYVISGTIEDVFEDGTFYFRVLVIVALETEAGSLLPADFGSPGP